MIFREAVSYLTGVVETPHRGVSTDDCYNAHVRTLIWTGVLAVVISIGSTAFIEWMQPSLVIVPEFLRFTIHHNAGIAYGIKLPDSVQTGVIVLALIIVSVIAVRSKREFLPDIGFGLIIGGALGNILDRLHDGFVTDFISIGTFPTFNIADSCISIGVGLLIVQELHRKKSR